MKYSGIDLHSNNSVVSVTDEEDRVVAERRLPNELERIIGKYWRSKPLVFSLLPRCQGLRGSQK